MHKMKSALVSTVNTKVYYIYWKSNI